MARLRRILHLSDPHLTGTGIDMDGVDARAALTGLLHDLRHLGDLDLVLVSGDLADDGSVEGVRMCRDLVGAYAEERGVPHVYTTGNHDDRDAFASVLGVGHLGVDAAPGPGCAAVSHHDGLRVVTLDSLVPGRTQGVLDDDQLAWLGEVLTTSAPAGTVVALHHPPIHVASVPATADVVLQEPHRLGALLAGSDVRAVLTGHLHHQLAGALAGVPVWVTPGIVTRIDLSAPADRMRAVLGAGATVVELVDGAPPSFHVVQARAADATAAVYDEPWSVLAGDEDGAG